MNLDKNLHRKMMLKILADISTQPLLANNLGFKGGTACYFIYGLDRFSVDLDFDLLSQGRETLIKETLLELLEKYGTVKTRTSIKVNYASEVQSLKIDLSSRHDFKKINTYQVKEVVSRVPIKVLKKEDIFAHKLVALTQRNCAQGEKPVVANRDLYDIHFFFKQNWDFNQKIIQTLSGYSALEYLQLAAEFVEEHVNSENILERLGELVDEKKKNWIKKNLKNEVLKELAISAKMFLQ